MVYHTAFSAAVNQGYSSEVEPLYWAPSPIVQRPWPAPPRLETPDPEGYNEST